MAALRLSNREADIVKQACYDDSVGVIAARLGLSPHTVHTHRERLYRKLNVNSLCQVMSVVFAAHVSLERMRLSPEMASGLDDNCAVPRVKHGIACTGDSQRADDRRADS